MVQLGDVLKAVGPNPAIVFAAWIFLEFLQQGYEGDHERDRKADGDYRAKEDDATRSGSLKNQVLAYRRRCRLMSGATLVGLLAAILLISSLIFGGLDVIVPRSTIVTICGIATTMGGFVLVIVATLIVIVEGRIVKRQIDDELRDVSDLAEEAGGGVADER